jgi:predicted transcriptional regulator
MEIDPNISIPEGRSEKMRADREKLDLAMARACITTAQLSKDAKMPRPTVNNVISGRSVRPSTMGKIAVALRVDVAEILKKEA